MKTLLAIHFSLLAFCFSSFSTAEPLVLPGDGLAERPFLYAGEWDFRHEQQTLFIVREGKVDWTYQIPLKDEKGRLQEFSDATYLSNGNVLFAYMRGARLVSPDKSTVWSFEAPEGFEVHVAQAIARDKVMIVCNGNPATVKLFDTRTGRLEREFRLATGNPNASHGQFRRVRMTRQGTVLAAHMDWNKVAEYDLEGKRLWELAVLSPWAAVRLHNGNTLVTSNRGFVREFGPGGNLVWEFLPEDAPGLTLFSPQEANRLSNGNTVISYWCPGSLKDPSDWSGTIQVIEVSPSKEIVWALSSWEGAADLGPATCIQLLDEEGVPELLEQQR